MGPRFGRLYATAVLRPLAEQLVAALDVQSGETACDLMCDSATLGLMLGAAVGTRGRALLVDSDDGVLAAAAGDVATTGCSVSTAVVTAGRVPVDGGSCDRVASLCTAGFWDGRPLLDEVERITHPAGSAAVLMWDREHPPAHEVALADALRDRAGVRSSFLRRYLQVRRFAQQSHWSTTQLQDVVRFDGIAHYWVAMVVERPIDAELDAVSETVRQAVRAGCERNLERFTAADGTIRIPVWLTLLRLRTSGES
jgi:ubiquinone/menaquinone biosynthesis C-methylase UbiE